MDSPPKQLQSKKDELHEHLNKAIEVLRASSDEQIGTYFREPILGDLLSALAPVKSGRGTGQYELYDYLLKHKNGLQIVALIRHAITHNYPIQGTVNGEKCYVSPDYAQWYDDGVMFLQGIERFAGQIGLYQGGDLKFAVAARDIAAGEHDLGPDAFLFLSIEEFQNSPPKNIPSSDAEMDAAIRRLEGLLLQKVQDESRYQEYIAENAWILGAQYSRIERHTNLDDKNIPDFTGVRVRDVARDIFEIKQPFLPLFTNKGDFSANFNASWNQCERYLTFALDQCTYLKSEKNLHFENPRCLLLIGYNLTQEQLRSLRRKERMNALVTIYTYNDLLVMAKSTVDFIQKHKDKS